MSQRMSKIAMTIIQRTAMDAQSFVKQNQVLNAHELKDRFQFVLKHVETGS